MAKASEQEHTGSTLARAGKRKWGYDTSQVDEFLERVHALYEEDEPKISQSDIQNTAFSLQKNGYVISQVDAALHRLENAVVDKQTQWDIAQAGRVAWQAQTQSLAQSLFPRAQREPKTRFADGPARKPSYDRKQVDRFIDQVVGKLQRELGFDESPADNETAQADSQITASSIANVIFTQRKGKRGYAERQVDAYLNRAIQVFSRLESYARLEETLGALEEAHDQEQASDQENAQTRVAHPVVPLFPQATVEGQAQEDPHEYGYVSQYDALRAQEQEIFNPDALVQQTQGSDALARLQQSSAQEPTSVLSAAQPTQVLQETGHDAVPATEGIAESSISETMPAPASETTIATAPTTASATTPAVFYPANFDFSVSAPTKSADTNTAEPVEQQAQVQQVHANTEPEPVAEGERTTSFTPIFDEPEFDYAAFAQQYASQQQTAQSDNSADAVTESVTPAVPADTNQDVASSTSQSNLIEGDSSSTSGSSNATDSASGVDDDYFSKLLGMDTIESTDFHIPNLVFPSTDTSQEQRDESESQSH